MEVRAGNRGGSARAREEEMGGGPGPEAAGRVGETLGWAGGGGRPGWGARGDSPPPPAARPSPLTSLASAFHVGAKAMQWPHQEAKNSTAQALREPSTAPRTVSACSSVSGSEDE